MKLSYVLLFIFLSTNVNAQKTPAAKAAPATPAAAGAKAEDKQKAPKPKPGSWLDVCKTEIEKFCAKEPNQTSTHTRMCLLSNVGKISTQCEKLVFNGQADTALTIARNPECYKDIAKYCANFAGTKAVTPCLREHASQISQDCKNTQDTEYKNL